MKILKNRLKKLAQQIFISSSVQVRQDIDAKMLTRLYVRRCQLTDHILHCKESGVISQKYADCDIIVSLTTYGVRIHEVAFTIESLMQQTMKANRIILWLDESFKEKQLPHSLLLQQKRGLEISFCPDIRSYTKLIPQLQRTPNDAIVTVDDDIIYDYDFLEHLIHAYLDNPQVIHSCRIHRIGLNKEGIIIPYSEWEKECVETGINPLNFLTGCGGVLYPPGCFDQEVFNKKVYLAICPYADDIWFTAMAIYSGTPINKVFTRNKHGEDFLFNSHVQGEKLVYKNITLKGNDSQLQAVFTKYSLFDKLRANIDNSEWRKDHN